MIRTVAAAAVAGVMLVGCGSSDGTTPGSPDGAVAGAKDGAAGGATDAALDSGPIVNLPGDGSDGLPGAAVVSGTVSGLSLRAKDTIGLYGIDPESNVPYAGVWISSQPGACAWAQGGGVPLATSALLSIEVAWTPGSPPRGPGTFVFAAPSGVPGPDGIALFAQFAGYDTRCALAVLEDAVGGAVQLDTAGDGGVAGRFDIVFASGDGGVDELTGTFSGPVCAFDMNAVGASDASACVTPPADSDGGGDSDGGAATDADSDGGGDSDGGVADADSGV